MDYLAIDTDHRNSGKWLQRHDDKGEVLWGRIHSSSDG